MDHDQPGHQTPGSWTPEDSDPLVTDYRPPIWDSWSDPPEAFPVSPADDAAGADDPTQTWTLGDDDDDEGESTAPDLGPALAAVPRADLLRPHPGHDQTDDAGDDFGDDEPRTRQFRREDHDASPELSPGCLVSGRYRLEEELTVRGGTFSWRAFDQKLSRPVMLHLLDQDEERNTLVLDAARRAAVATDSRFLRVLDAVRGDQVDGPMVTNTGGDPVEGVGAYIVAEFVPGMSVERLLSSGPLSGLEAAWIIRELADALAPMHAQGLFHQQLNPDTVVVTATGNVKIVGFLTEEAMFPTHDDDIEADLPPEQDDVTSMGQLLYAALVRRWPAPHEQAGRHHWGMASAPMDGHGWLTPRQVKAGVSPALDVVCDQVLNVAPRTGGSPIASASMLTAALSRVLGTADAAADLEHRVRYPAAAPVETSGWHPVARDEEPSPGEPEPLASAAGDADLDEPEPEPDEDRNPPRRWLAILVGLVALTMLGSLIAVAINSGGWAQQKAEDPPASSAPAKPQPLPIASVDDFDPEKDGGNGDEIPDQVAMAWDKKPKTAWVTMRYKNNPKLGGLKPGVGLVVDLGSPVDVGRVDLQLQGKPTAVQLRVPKDAAAKQPPMETAQDWRVVAKDDKAAEKVTLKPAKVVRTRYVLVYLTSLPNVGGTSYRGAIAEIEVYDQ